MERSTKTRCKRCGYEEEASSPKRVKSEIDVKARQEESYFYQLFSNVLDFLMQREKVPDETIALSVESIINSFRFSKGNKFSDVDYERTENICAYLYRYATHGAGLVRNRVLDAINNCDVLKDCFKAPALNIVSLGGGPGNDMIGLCSALYESQCRGVLNLTVVDSVRRWASCLNLLEFFVREGSYGDVSELFRLLTVNLSFIQTTLPGNLESDPKYFRSVKEADMIVIPKLMSILEEDVREAIIKSLSKEAKPDALLLYIDSPFLPNVWMDFDILYHSNSEDYRRSEITNRFKNDDSVSSKSQIAVLRKKVTQ